MCTIYIIHSIHIIHDVQDDDMDFMSNTNKPVVSNDAMDEGPDEVPEDFMDVDDTVVDDAMSVVSDEDVVVACAVSEHRSRAPVESCGVVYCTPQALSLFPESWHSVLCLPLCLCPFLLVYCPPVYIYCSGLGTFPPVSFLPLQVSSFALLPLISVSFLPLQSPSCSVTQGPFESHF